MSATGAQSQHSDIAELLRDLNHKTINDLGRFKDRHRYHSAAVPILKISDMKAELASFEQSGDKTYALKQGIMQDRLAPAIKPMGDNKRRNSLIMTLPHD